MANGVTTGLHAGTAARAITAGAIANTLVKLGVVVVVGTGTFRRRAAGYLATLAAATAMGLAMLALRS